MAEHTLENIWSSGRYKNKVCDTWWRTLSTMVGFTPSERLGNRYSRVLCWVCMHVKSTKTLLSARSHPRHYIALPRAYHLTNISMVQRRELVHVQPQHGIPRSRSLFVNWPLDFSWYWRERESKSNQTKLRTWRLHVCAQQSSVCPPNHLEARAAAPVAQSKLWYWWNRDGD